MIMPKLENEESAIRESTKAVDKVEIWKNQVLLFLSAEDAWQIL